jgi:hypothetical protein
VKLFEKLRTWLPAMEEKADGRQITYTRGGESITVTARVGRTAFAQNEEGKARILIGDRDYLIEVANLTFGEPRIGDRITEAIDGTAHVFEIMDLPTGEPPWRYSDPDHTTWRIHVKRVS